MTFPVKDDKRLLFYFMAAWMLVNIIQAAATGLDGDEAYYWMFSRQLAWGYFDHPPFVALSIKLGEYFGHGRLLTRLGTILFSTGTIYFLYRALPEQFRNTQNLILVFASVVLFNMYGFIVTPDASLLFFTAIYFYSYKKFLRKNGIAEILLLAFSITGMLYSKYHGVLPVLFTFLSFPKLVLKPSAWLVVLLVALAMVPHLLWQNNHDWATLRYHLSERIGSAYRFDKSTNYLATQLFIWGPFTTIPALYFIMKNKEKDLYSRAHKFTLWGVFIFFLLSSFRSTIEAHWTLSAGISFVVLFVQYLSKATSGAISIFRKLLFVNIICLFIARIMFTTPGSPLKNITGFQSVFHGERLADSVYVNASGKPVVFVNSYAQASLYKYYHTDVLTTSYNTIPNRKNYFNLSGDESQLNEKDVLIATGYDFGKPLKTIQGFNDPVHMYELHSFIAVNQLKLEWKDFKTRASAGEVVDAVIQLTNSANDSVTIQGKLFINYSFIKTRKEFYSSLPQPVLDKTAYPIQLKMPVAKGKYSLIFSIVQPPFQGAFSSPFYEVVVE